jgi:hypothetical protein
MLIVVKKNQLLISNFLEVLGYDFKTKFLN